ncbi:MAG: putative Ig domain-containing protein [Ignavibacteriaceae bacterium]
MKRSFILVIPILFISSSLLAQVIPQDSLYLAQTPPGTTPKIFNLAVTSGHHACERIAITSDGKEIYYGELNGYTPSSYRVRCYKYQDNEWQGPFTVFEGYIAPSLSVNDSIIYMQNNIFYTYYSIRTYSGWSVPAKLLSGNQRLHYFQRTNLNNSFASSYYEGSPLDGNISRVMVVNQDTILQSFGIPLNSSAQENDFYIAPDESYIFFSRNVTGGAGDIYLSYKKDNGGWTNPKKLGEPINKPGAYWEYGQFVSNDNKYLFFTSGGTNMNTYYTYWVRIDALLDSLRCTNFAPYLLNQIPNQTDSVGYNFNYTFSDTTFIDDDGNNTLTYSATLSNGNPLPSWLSFDPSTRLFYGTPTNAGNIIIKVTATDTANAKASCTFTLIIADPVTDVNDDGQSLNDFQLQQNYPNPFNPATNIQYAISNKQFVTLKVYDVLGNEVETLVNEFKPAGNYEVEFIASGISSGIYFYVLKTNNFCAQKKMIVLK